MQWSNNATDVHYRTDRQTDRFVRNIYGSLKHISPSDKHEDIADSHEAKAHPVQEKTTRYGFIHEKNNKEGCAQLT